MRNEEAHEQEPLLAQSLSNLAKMKQNSQHYFNIFEIKLPQTQLHSK